MREYLLSAHADIGPCIDVKGYGSYVYAIQRSSQFPTGRLCVLDTNLRLIAEVCGIGNARQIEIANGVAVISAREDGILLFDVTGQEPQLLSRYRTVEYATGVTLYADLALISCRQYGVEVIDISDPRAPRHVCLIRVGEVQSACVYRDVLYCGVWGTMKVVCVDIHDLSCPRIIAELPLDGRGDGVVARDGFLYAVHGQHARGIQNVADENDPCFGMGNGVTVFDIHDPISPVKVCQKHFGKGHHLHYDMWEAALYGDDLVCSDSVLGVFVYDAQTMVEELHISLPRISGQDDPVTGVSACGGKLFVASAMGGIFRFDGRAFADGFRYDAARPPLPSPTALQCEGEGPYTLSQRYIGPFSVKGAATMGEWLVLAAAEGGIHIIGGQDFSLFHCIETDSACVDVKVHGSYIFAALAHGGLAIYHWDGARAEYFSRLTLDAPVLQLSLSASGRYLLCGVGASSIKLIDVSDRRAPRPVHEYTVQKGQLYGENFAANTLSDGTMLAFCHRDGLLLCHPDAGDTRIRNICFQKKNGILGYGPENGCDTDGTHIFYNVPHGYVLLPLHDDVTVEDLAVCDTKQTPCGKLTVCGELLISTERAIGIVTVTDIRDVHHPRMLATLRTNASPAPALSANGRIFIPGGYGGLLELHQK